MKKFSLTRLFAIMVKEFIQMRRDRGTLAMMVALPLMQVILFGFAINSDPKHLPTAIITADHSEFSRTFIEAMQNSKYFAIQKVLDSEEEGKKVLQAGKYQFVVNIPIDFTRKLVRGETPQILLEADATDPAATGNAISALNKLATKVFKKELQGNLFYLQTSNPPLMVTIHPKYNPAGITQYNIVTGLLGVVLTMTMAMTTSVAMTRERDRGTMESLLVTPVHPLELMLGKIMPYIIVGYTQMTLILFIGKLLFSIPTLGNIFLLFLLTFPFIAANLSVGMTISTIAKNPLQATQMAVFFFLPSILLSGFMFPFRGMPVWAQYLGECLPLTHFLRIVRGILLKGSDFTQIWTQLIAILIFLAIVILLGTKRFKRTLDQ